MNLAVPDIHEYYSVVEAIHAKLEASGEFTADERDKVKPISYGHMADGDIQISISVHGHGQESIPLVEKASRVLDPFLVEFITSKKGSITGEHGIGLQRAE